MRRKPCKRLWSCYRAMDRRPKYLQVERIWSVSLKFGKRTPAHVIDIKKLAELKSISKGTVIKIGAGNNFKTVQDCFAGSIVYAGLYESIYSIGKTQVLNMGTVGGNLANGSPKADTAPPVAYL